MYGKSRNSENWYMLELVLDLIVMERPTWPLNFDKLLHERAVSFLHYRSTCYAEIPIYGKHSQYYSIKTRATRRNGLKNENCPLSRTHDLQAHLYHRSKRSESERYIPNQVCHNPPPYVSTPTCIKPSPCFLLIGFIRRAGESVWAPIMAIGLPGYHTLA